MPNKAERKEPTRHGVPPYTFARLGRWLDDFHPTRGTLTSGKRYTCRQQQTFRTFAKKLVLISKRGKTTEANMLLVGPGKKVILVSYLRHPGILPNHARDFLSQIGNVEDFAHRALKSRDDSLLGESSKEQACPGSTVMHLDCSSQMYCYAKTERKPRSDKQQTKWRPSPDSVIGNFRGCCFLCPFFFFCSPHPQSYLND